MRRQCRAALRAVRLAASARGLCPFSSSSAARTPASPCTRFCQAAGSSRSSGSGSAAANGWSGSMPLPWMERPDGVKIGACFIAAIILVSLLSRLKRALELRTIEIEYDAKAESFFRDVARRQNIRLIANEPDERDVEEYRAKMRQIVDDHDLPDAGDIIFVEVTVTDASDFESDLHVLCEVMHHRYRVLSMASPSVPGALAALLLWIRDTSQRRPHIYFEWTEGNPVANFARYLIFGQGEVAPVTREMLRQAEPDRHRRPHVHVG